MERIGKSLAVMEDNWSELQERSIFQTGVGFIIRYVHTDERKQTSVQESFVGFTAVKDTTGQGLAEKLIEAIEKSLGLEEDSERRPSFNPGEIKLEAILIPCCSHSLSLSLSLILFDGASPNRECLTFFATLQRLYTNNCIVGRLGELRGWGKHPITRLLIKCI